MRVWKVTLFRQTAFRIRDFVDMFREMSELNMTLGDIHLALRFPEHEVLE